MFYHGLCHSQNKIVRLCAKFWDTGNSTVAKNRRYLLSTINDDGCLFDDPRKYLVKRVVIENYKTNVDSSDVVVGKLIRDLCLTRDTNDTYQ